MTFETVILTHQSAGTPHLAAIRAANPDAVIHIHTAADPTSEEARNEAWRNCDRNMRAWWMQHRETCAADAILFMEWDALANRSLTGELDALNGRAGMAAAHLASPIRDGRRFAPFRETNRLPAEIRHLAIGAIPMGVVGLTRAALNGICETRWDSLYQADVFSELRLPTVVRACGFEVIRHPQWNRVGTTPFMPGPGETGIFHPVKTELP